MSGEKDDSELQCEMITVYKWYLFVHCGSVYVSLYLSNLFVFNKAFDFCKSTPDITLTSQPVHFSLTVQLRVCITQE